MSEQTMALAQQGFGAWVRGDFETLEAMFDSRASWHAVEPGEWDCHGRDDVMRTLRERYEQGFARSSMELVDADDETVIVIGRPREVAGPEWPEETATTVTFRDGKVVAMQDHPTRQAAIDSLGNEGRG
jgi:ketosteroid isomerase-like protein